ncbi:MAG TPA: YggT family protein [Pyrinomonadaceae bacterium]|jgi:YggT family protein
MQVILAIYLFFRYGIAAVVIAVILLMITRLALNYADLNPFSRPVIFVRRLTDPLVNPVRRSLLQFGFGPNMAPLVTILILILVGWFALLLVEGVLNMIAGVLYAVPRGAIVQVVGYVLYGLLGLYSLLIFIRIIFSWGMLSYSNRVMRLLVDATDPLLMPLRRIIPPLAMLDLSPIVAFILLWLFQAAIYGTLINPFPLRFVGFINP